MQMSGLAAGWMVVIFLFGVWVGHFVLPGHAFRPSSRMLASVPPVSTSQPFNNQRQKGLFPTTPATRRVTSSQTNAPVASVAPVLPVPRKRLLRMSELPFIAFDRLATVRQRQRALHLLNQLSFPCGCGVSIAQCAKAQPSCQRVKRLIEQVLDQVSLRRPDNTVRQTLALFSSEEDRFHQLRRNRISFGQRRTRRQKTSRGRGAYVPIQGAAVRGTASAPLTVVVFADFQCDYSRQLWSRLRMLELMYGVHNVRVVFRHFPLAMHPRAKAAAYAAIAAQKQGAFWPFHALLYARQDRLSERDFVSHAKQLKLDLKQFKKDLGAKSVKQIVKQDLALAASLRLVGTPAIFINGLQVSSLSQLNHIAKRAWKQAQDALQIGVPARKLYELLAKNASKQTRHLP